MDFSRYPDKAYQLNWIRHYLACQAQLKGNATESVTDRDIEDCYVKINKFALVSLIFVATALASRSYTGEPSGFFVVVFVDNVYPLSLAPFLRDKEAFCDKTSHRLTSCGRLFNISAVCRSKFDIDLLLMLCLT